MIVRDRWKDSTSKVLYVSAEKELPDANSQSFAYWWLASNIGDRFPFGATLSEIYHEILGPKGLSSYDAGELVRNALRFGYLRKGGVPDEEG